MTPEEVAPIQGVLTDIDDTLTLHGRLVPEAFTGLSALQAAGLKVIPVTGRPAGWVDHIARMWPVDGVVGENGGLWFYMAEGKLQQRYLQDDAERKENRRRLEGLAMEMLLKVPGCALASDQGYRALDLAIDFCEDVPALTEADIDKIVETFEAAGAVAKVSSIHVNGWYGRFDKLTGFQRLAAELGVTSAPEAWIYVGDSANDAPMFEHFPCSVGVANVDHFLHRLPVWPKFRTASAGGVGFGELVARVLALR